MKCFLGECYEEIGRLYEEQPRLDWEHIADMMHDYKGLLAGWPQVLHIHSVSFLFEDSRQDLLNFHIIVHLVCVCREPRGNEKRLRGRTTQMLSV